MQSSPLNFRRAIIWIGRLVLGCIFIYAGYAKIFLPNRNLWPFFILKFSISMNLSNFATQVEAFKLLPAWGVQFVAHTLPFTEIILGLLASDWLAPAHLGSDPHRHHAGILRCGFARVSPAHGHQLRMFCDSPADQSSEGVGRRGALRTCAADDHLRLYGSTSASSVVSAAERR